MELSTGKILEKNLVVCFPPDTGIWIHLSAGQQPKTQVQIYTGIAYQEDRECSWVAEIQLWLISTWKSLARPENGCLAMINNQLDKSLKNFENNKWASVVQSRCGKLLRDVPRKTASTKYWLRGVNSYVNEIFLYFMINNFGNISKIMFSICHYGELSVDGQEKNKYI
jgi:hypothetical protein